MKQILLIMIGLSSLVCADRFSRSAEGVVTDSQTNLQWQDDYGDNGGTIKTTTWQGAIDYCEALALDNGYWRLPNKKELLSIVDYSAYNSSISSTFANTTSNRYWSSTSVTTNTSFAWSVYFSYGDTSNYYKTSTVYVRCVRAGQ